MNQQIIGSNAIIFNKNGEILMMKRSNDDEAFPGEWELPGGGVDYSETPQESLKREIKEECGLNVEVHNPLGVNSFYLDNSRIVEITFLCTIIDSKFDVKLSDEHSEYRWISFENINSLNLNDYMSKVVNTAKSSLD